MIGLLLFCLSLFLFFNEKKRYLAVCCLFVIATAGFQLVPADLFLLPAIGISKPYDWLLIFCGAIFFLEPKVFIQTTVLRRYRNIGLFAFVLIFLLLYSIFYRGVEVSISIRVFRNFIFFVLLYVFVLLPIPDLLKVFRFVAYVTTIASLVYCLQVVAGKPLLNTVGSDLVTTNDESAPTRYYNLPVFIFPVVFFFFFPKESLNLKFRNTMMAINFLAIVLSQHRNLLLAITSCYVLHMFLSHKIKPSRLLVYGFFIFAAFNIGDSLLGSRFSQGANDLSEVNMNASPVTMNALNTNELSTTEFRWYLFAERLEYVLRNPVTSIFGIGMLTEDSKLTRNLRFNIGLPDEVNGVTQVDTGDIIWSVMILQFGLAGILFFVLYYLSFLKKFLYFKTDPVVQTGILLIVVLFITSFYGTSILQPYTTCILMLFAAYNSRLYDIPNPENMEINLQTNPVT